MFQNFRNLPPVVRIGIAIAGFGVLLGALVIVIALLSGQGAQAPKPSKAPQPVGSPSVSVSPQPSASPTPSPDPSAALEEELRSLVPDNGSSSKLITDSQRAAAEQVALRGYLAWCTRDSKSASTPAKVKALYYANIRKYFTADAEQSDPDGYIGFVQDQVCEVHANQLQNVYRKDIVSAEVFASTATVYEDDTPTKTTNQAYVNNTGAIVYMRLVDGKWRIFYMKTEGL